MRYAVAIATVVQLPMTILNAKYAGNKKWNEVLEEDAYISDKTGSSTKTYLLNTESLQTAWFINKVALKKAASKGYDVKDKDGNPGNPTTWAELIQLCEAMQAAGYEHPLGLALDNGSLNGTQFTWLQRVYGDYYYRNEYNQIATDYGTYEVDVTSKDPELDFKFSETSLYNVVLDQGTTERDYVGATSLKFKDFLQQFKNISGFISPTAAQKTFKSVRNEFQNQESNDAPQIFLDYAGESLGFDSKLVEGKFEYDFFDYPRMNPIDDSIDIDEETIIRDVGGNGGYLSIINHGGTSGTKQRNLSLAFMKFLCLRMDKPFITINYKIQVCIHKGLV